MSGLHLIPASLQVYSKFFSLIEITLSTSFLEISSSDNFVISSSAKWKFWFNHKKNTFKTFLWWFLEYFHFPFNSSAVEWKRQSGQWIIRKLSFIINSSNKSCRKRNFSAYLAANSWRTSAGPKDASQYIKSCKNWIRNRMKIINFY